MGNLFQVFIQLLASQKEESFLVLQQELPSVDEWLR